jgi:tetratricopeptide (TPR) repeat protein
MLRGISQYPIAALLILGVLVCIGFGARSIGSYAWAEYHYQAAQRALEKRDIADARRHISLCLEARPQSADAHFLAARAARQASDYDDADHHLAEYKKLGGEPKLVELERDLARAQRGDLNQVEAKLKDLLQSGYPDDLPIREALTRGYLQTYRLVDAMYALEDWLQRRPDDVQAILWRAEALEHLQKVEDALAAYRRGLELSPDRDEDRLRLAELLIKAQQPQEAFRNLELIAHHRPDDPKVLLAQARCLRLLGKPDDACRLLDEVNRLTPEDAAAFTERGRLELAQGRAADAEPWLRKAVALAPFERETVYAMFQCLQQRARAAEAAHYKAELDKNEAALDRLSQLAKQINTTPNDPALRYEAGMIFLNSGQPQEGLRWLASALQVDPGYVPVHQALADYYERMGNRDRASWHRDLALRKLSTRALGSGLSRH